MSTTAQAASFYTANAARHGASDYGSILNGFEVSRDGILRFGVHRVPLDRVKRYAPLNIQERDIDSVLSTVAVFMGGAAFLLVLVFEMGWRERFLVGGLLFASIAIGAIVDLSRTMQLNLFRLKIELEDQRPVTFVTPDRDMLSRVMQVIEQNTGLKPDFNSTTGHDGA